MFLWTCFLFQATLSHERILLVFLGSQQTNGYALFLSSIHNFSLYLIGK